MVLKMYIDGISLNDEAWENNVLDIFSCHHIFLIIKTMYNNKQTPLPRLDTRSS